MSAKVDSKVERSRGHKESSPIVASNETVSLLHDSRATKELFVYRFDDFLLKTIVPVSDAFIREVAANSLRTPEPVKEALGGRASLIHFSDPNGSALNSGGHRYVLKSYRRGGMLRKLLPGGVFLGWGEARSIRELRAMLTAQELKVSVPEPVGTLVKGSLFKREWLIMHELSSHHSLASLAFEVEREEVHFPLEECIEEVVRQLEMLIQNGILHVDLHPGNVVVTEEGQVFIIDFDHAERVSIAPKYLRERYIRRWRRAVIKHELPEFLSEVFCSLLRRRWDLAELDGESEVLT